MSTRRPAKLPRRVARKESSPDKSAAIISDNDDDCNNKAVANPECELTYDVLTIIFKYLNARDLRSAAKVCRCWSEVAGNEKRLRGSSVLRLFGVLHNAWSDLCPENDFADQLRMKPMLGFTVTRNFDVNHPASKETNTDCPCNALPSDFANVIVGGYGIVNDQIESEMNPDNAASCIFLPEEPGVSVQTFYGLPIGKGNKARRDLCRRKNIMKMRKMVGQYSSTKNETKCCICLSSDESDVYPGADLLEIGRCDQARTFCGGYVQDLAICKQDENGKFCNHEMLWIGILISGPSVRSWCAVLSRKCNNKAKVEAKLNLLRDQVQLKKHSMGFMVACRSRGKYMYGESNVESTIFKKIFPQVPLIGMFSGGEFGDSTIEHLPRRTHEYSTVFMILTYG